jgi:copper homeostasis protein
VPVVFHRAFDLTPDPFASLEQLIALGVRRVLTSGQEVTAPAGVAILRALIQQAGGRIEILPGGGINRSTVADLVARTVCVQVHVSLRSARPEPSAAHRPQIRFGTLPTEDCVEVTDTEKVADMVSRLAEPGASA